MRRSLVPFGVALLACACSSSTSSTPARDAATAADTAIPADGGAPTDASTPADTGSTGTGLPGDEYCRSAAAGVTCGRGQTNTCGVCIALPARNDALERTNCDDTQRREYCRTGTVGAPNLQCYQPGSYPTAGTPQMVTIWGYVRVFGNGGNSQHIKVSVYRVAADGNPGELIGATVSDITSPGSGMEDVFSPSRDRVLFTRQTGGFQIPNVPTETELLVVTEGDPADAQAAGLWSHRIYDYNTLLSNGQVDMDTAPAGINGTHKVRFLPRVISNSDWTAIPATATLTSGITRGRGAFAGEVHDCDDVRLANASVDSSPRRAWDGPVVYFSDNDTNPLPDLSRDATSLLGTYALLDLDPGVVRVAASGYDANHRLIHLGSYRARVFADSITLVTLRGMRPWQVP